MRSTTRAAIEKAFGTNLDYAIPLSADYSYSTLPCYHVRLKLPTGRWPSLDEIESATVELKPFKLSEFTEVLLGKCDVCGKVYYKKRPGD